MYCSVLPYYVCAVYCASFLLFCLFSFFFFDFILWCCSGLLFLRTTSLLVLLIHYGCTERIVLLLGFCHSEGSAQIYYTYVRACTRRHIRTLTSTHFLFCCSTCEQTTTATCELQDICCKYKVGEVW